MCTLVEPARGVYDQLASFEQGPNVSLSFAPGFPAADFPECGPVIWGYGFDEEALTAAVDALFTMMVADEAQWEVPFLTPDEAVTRAVELGRGAEKPVIIADTQHIDPRIDYLIEEQKPFVAFGRSLSGGAHPWVDPGAR